MKKLRIIVTLLLVVCLISSVSLISVSADDSEREPDHLRYSGVRFLTAGVVINSWGKASCESCGELYDGYSADLEICLYKVTNDGYDLVKYWDLGTKVGDFLEGKPYYVVHGTYFTEATLTVYDSNSNYVETVSVASGNYVY